MLLGGKQEIFYQCSGTKEEIVKGAFGLFLAGSENLYICSMLQ